MLLILSVALGVAGTVLMITGDPLHAIGGFLMLGMAVVALVGSLIEQAITSSRDAIVDAIQPPEHERDDR
jgi:hypothetical protein